MLARDLNYVTNQQRCLMSDLLIHFSRFFICALVGKLKISGVNLEFFLPSVVDKILRFFTQNLQKDNNNKDNKEGRGLSLQPPAKDHNNVETRASKSLQRIIIMQGLSLQKPAKDHNNDEA